MAEVDKNTKDLLSYGETYKATGGGNNNKLDFKPFKGVDEEDCINYIYKSLSTDASALYEKVSCDLDLACNKTKPSYKFLLAIQKACDNLKKCVNDAENNNNNKEKIKIGIEECKNLQEAFEKASKFSKKDSFLAATKVKTYMTNQSNTLKKSINKMKIILKSLDNLDKKKTKNPIKKYIQKKKDDYTAKKTKEFLSAVNNAKFKEFIGPSQIDENQIYSAYEKYYNNIKTVASTLEGALEKELKKKSNEKKDEKNEKTSKKYLSEINDACKAIKFYAIKNKSNDDEERNRSIYTSLSYLNNLQEALANAATFSDKHKISFLSNQKVRTYMFSQAKILKSSIKTLESAFGEGFLSYYANSAK